MKLFALIGLLVFAGTSFAHTARMMNYKVHCTGITHAGMTYRLNVDYVIDRNYLGLEGPYTIILNDREVTATLRAFEGGRMIYRDDVMLDEIRAKVTDDQTTYDYASVDQPDNWITIAPSPGDVGGGDSFSYSLNGATGSFRNGRCEIAERRAR